MKRRQSELTYRIAGLPTAIRHLWRRNCNSAASIRLVICRSVLASTNCRGSTGPYSRAVAVATGRAYSVGRISLAKRRSGRAPGSPFLPSTTSYQLWLYIAAGVLPPMYYVYELYKRPLRRHARSFLFRCETKGGIYRVVNRDHRVRAPSSTTKLRSRSTAVHTAFQPFPHSLSFIQAP